MAQASCGILGVLLGGGWGKVVHPQDMQGGRGDSPCLLAPLCQEEGECVRSKSSYWKRSEQTLIPHGPHWEWQEGAGKALAAHCPGNPLSLALPLALPLQPPTPVSKQWRCRRTKDEDAEDRNFSKELATTFGSHWKQGEASADWSPSFSFSWC